jgi:hypothetical protein
VIKLTQGLLTNFYYCLSPPPCQVEEHDNNATPVPLSTTSASPPPLVTPLGNKIARKWLARLRRRHPPTTPGPPRQYIIGKDDNELLTGIHNGTIATTLADSGATSSIGTTSNPSTRTGCPSHKQFTLPNGTIIPATEIAHYPFNVRSPANELHITPGIGQHSLLSTVKFADANYITIFDKDLVNVYDANDTAITVSKGAVLRGFRDPA